MNFSINLTWKIFPQTMLIIQNSKHRDTIMQIIPALYIYFSCYIHPVLEPNLSQHEFRELPSVLKFLEFECMSVMEMFLKIWLTCWNLSSFSYYFCITILEFVYISSTFLCGLISLDKWLVRNWQMLLIFLNFFQLKFPVVIDEMYKNRWRCPGWIWFVNYAHSRNY